MSTSVRGLGYSVLLLAGVLHMHMRPTQGFRSGRVPCDPPPRLWGPILVWQLLCWPVAALGNAIRHSEATGDNRRLAARAERLPRPSQAGGRDSEWQS